MDLAALFKVSYGVYLVSSVKDGKYNAYLANTVCQVNSDPPTFQVVVNKDNLTHDYIVDSGLFSISILSEDTPFPFLGKFGFKSGRDTDKFESLQYHVGAKGTPVITENTVAYLVCEVFKTVDMGSHTIFIGNLLDCGQVGPGTPMTYAYYHEVKKGKTAKNAPTYINPDSLKS